MATAARITGAVTRWWWVRHAPVPNPEARCYGQTDQDCDVSNEALFRHQASLLPKKAVWYASNLLRARKTAEHLARAGADMQELNVDPDLAEQHFGAWQGLTYVEIAENHGRNHLFWLGPPELRPPGGESFVDLRERTVRSIERLTAEHRGRLVKTTGDGLLTALKIASLVAVEGPLEELVRGLKVYPQKIVNVRVRSKPPLESLPEVARALGEAERALDGAGRVVLRYSGTESLARVMVEAEQQADVDRWSAAIAAAVRATIGT